MAFLIKNIGAIIYFVLLLNNYLFNLYSAINNFLMFMIAISVFSVNYRPKNDFKKFL